MAAAWSSSTTRSCSTQQVSDAQTIAPKARFRPDIPSFQPLF
jgi:hypothetical protein